MRLPEELQIAIDQIVEKLPPKILAKARAEMTRDYKEGRISHFDEEAKRLVYLAARMPATYAAVFKALQNIAFHPKSLVDLGAGPGTASWAAVELFPELEKVTLVEQSAEAIALGQKLAAGSSAVALQKAEWIRASLPGKKFQGDLVVLSYMINELPKAEELISECWEGASVLAIIEPGTLKGAACIRKIREQLIRWGAHIAAPCPHLLACPSDWCHFSARVERSRLHRLVKEGSLGHEDEKFSYLIACKDRISPCQNRVLRHPAKNSGHVRLTLCAASGQVEEKVITKKNKEFYRKARDAEWGSPFPS